MISSRRVIFAEIDQLHRHMKKGDISRESPRIVASKRARFVADISVESGLETVETGSASVREF